MPLWSTLGNPFVFIGLVGVSIGVVVYQYLQTKKEYERTYSSQPYGSRPSGRPPNDDSRPPLIPYKSNKDLTQETTVRKRTSDIGRSNNNELKKTEDKGRDNQIKSNHSSGSSSSEKRSTAFQNSLSKQSVNVKSKDDLEKQTKNQEKYESKTTLSSNNDTSKQLKLHDPSSSLTTTSSSEESSSTTQNCDCENQKLKKKGSNTQVKSVKSNHSSSSSNSEESLTVFQNSRSKDSLEKQTRNQENDEAETTESSSNNEESSSTSQNCVSKNHKLKNKGNRKKRRGKQEREVSDTAELSNNHSKSSKHSSSSSEKSYKSSGHKKVEKWIRNQENLTSDSTQPSSKSESEFQSTSSSSEYQPFVSTGNNCPSTASYTKKYRKGQISSVKKNKMYDKNMNMHNDTNVGYDLNSHDQENNPFAEINDRVAENLCKACNEDMVTAINEPCGHSYLCSDCSRKVFQIYKKCYICKGVITGLKNIEK